MIEKMRDIDLPSTDRFTPFDNTGYTLSTEESDLCAKGLKFVPSSNRIDLHKKQKDFDKFARKLRIAVLFQDQQSQPPPLYPWTPLST